jgi:transforming growth factor-beta-induced protein
VNPAPPAPAVPVDVPVAAPVVDPTAGATETTIGGFVSGTSGLESLQAALVRAGLSGALSGAGDGPFTLFAPNNAAFQLLPDFFIDLLFVNDEFIPHLQDLLLYHILSGEFFGSDLELLAGVDGVSLPTVNTESIVVASPPLTVQGISVITPNNDVANGVLHIIDNVLAPSWVFNFISQRVIANTATSTLNALLVMAEIDLGQAGALTLLAPTNAAFDALGIPALEFLTDPDNVNALTLILAYHVIIGVFTTAELSEGLQIPTALGTTTVIVSVGQSTAFFNQAEIVDFDILALNGVVHTINAVLNPENSPTRR